MGRRTQTSIGDHPDWQNDRRRYAALVRSCWAMLIVGVPVTAVSLLFPPLTGMAQLTVKMAAAIGLVLIGLALVILAIGDLMERRRVFWPILVLCGAPGLILGSIGTWGFMEPMLDMVEGPVTAPVEVVDERLYAGRHEWTHRLVDIREADGRMTTLTIPKADDDYARWLRDESPTTITFYRHTGTPVIDGK